jgi:hypothetical protein
MPETFYIKNHEFDHKSYELKLNYTFDNNLNLTETIKFPKPKKTLTEDANNALNEIFEKLSIACGISYYKMYFPKNIEIENTRLTKNEKLFFDKFYKLGLAQTAYQNNIKDWQKRINFKSPTSENINTYNLNLKNETLTAVGGGKDSIVTIETLKKAAINQTLFAVTNDKENPPSAIKKTMQKAGLKSFFIERTLDPKLFKLNQNESVYNGHIPITGIIFFITAAACIISNTKNAAFSIEDSANEENLIWMGEKINHQWSKSFEFEKMFNNLITKIVPNLNVFSLLRPLSEFKIAENFANYKQYFNIFTSCNKAFKININERKKAWCGHCDKCRFVFLILSPFIAKKDLIEIFKKNMLDEKDELNGYLELIGEYGAKPFECVGEIEESILCFILATENEFKDDYIVKHITPCLKKYDKNTLLNKYNKLSDQHFLNKEFQKALYENIKS